MRIFSSIYVLLLSYIVVALGFWEYSLQKQSGQIYEQEIITLRSQIDSTLAPQEYSNQLEIRRTNLQRRTYQYIGEGSAFLAVILIGAFVVYTSFKRRILFSRQQNNFMLSVTHELKSPIAAMKLNLQTIEKHKLDEEKRSWLISRCIKEANRLNDLCNNILFTSRLEGGQYKPSGELFSFTTLAEDIVDEYGHRYPQRFSEDIATGCQVFGDRMMLEIAVNNLIENALKYSPADSMISISLHKTGKDAILRVTDMGVGIKDEEKKNVFTKFYRIGNEESRKTQGTGLGLYLTNKIIVQHKGRITIRDNKPTGAIFEICLPLAVAK